MAVRLKGKDRGRWYKHLQESHKLEQKKRESTPTTIQGEKFDSRSEGLRWLELKQDEREGKIRNLQRQPKFDLIINGIYVGKYTPDFCYLRNGGAVVEEYKGYLRPLHRLRMKIFHALYGDKCEFIVTGKGAKSWARRRKKKPTG